MLSDSLPMLSYEGVGTAGARLDARVKIVAALAAGIGVLLAHHPLQFASLTLLIALAAVLTRIPVSLVWGSVRPLLLFVIIGGGLIALTTTGSGWSFGPAHVSHAGLGLAGRLSAQLVLLLLITTLVTYTTAPLAVAGALRRLLGFLRVLRVPVEDMTTMLTIAITFMPIMSREVDRYLTARAARGANVRRLGIWSMLGDMLAPLIQANLERGDELALALDTRLYGFGKRTHRTDHRGLDLRSLGLLLTACAWVAASSVLL